MANRPPTYGKTIDFVLKGSDTGPGGGKGIVSSYGGAPTLFETDMGEQTLQSSQPGTKRVYPPMYDGNKNIGQNQKTAVKGKSGGGFVPTAGQLTASPKPF